MNYLVLSVTIYTSIGCGFLLCTWLQSAEIKVNKGERIPLISVWDVVMFLCLWWVMAIYCYRTEVSKTVKPIDLGNGKL